MLRHRFDQPSYFSLANPSTHRPELALDVREIAALLVPETHGAHGRRDGGGAGQDQHRDVVAVVGVVVAGVHVDEVHLQQHGRGRGLSLSFTHYLTEDRCRVVQTTHPVRNYLSKRCRNDVDVTKSSLSAPLCCRNRRNSGAEIDVFETLTSFRQLFD